jgi:hypothetical protein
MRRYSEAIKADVRRRMSPPNRQSVARISEETGIHPATLYLWRKGWRLEGEVAFVDWYNHRHRHSGIKFVTPHQRHSGAAIAICRERTQVYEKARQAHANRWSQSTRCWRQPVVVWINKPPEGDQSNQAL